MTAAGAQHLVEGSSLAQPPPGFIDDPYPFYAALRKHAPVHELGSGMLLLTRYGRSAINFAHPNRLDLARKPNGHLAFGQGAHACAGMNVARLEARIAIGRLVARWPHLPLRGVPQRDRRVRFRGWRQLPVSLR